MAEHNLVTDVGNSGISHGPAELQTSRITQRLFRAEAKDRLPLSIRHERIYILPTGRGLAFICVIAIMLMASINYGLNLGYALCFILIGLFASCLLATYQNLVKIRFDSISTSDTYQGSILSYKINITEETGRERQSITLSSQHARDTVDISARGSTTATLSITDIKRGVHHLGRLTLSSDFPLGLWRGWGYLHTPLQTHVYPQPENPVPAFAGYNASAAGPMARRSGEQEYTGLKTYETTDSPSRIAWKRVASGAGWYSKQFEPEAEQREVAIRWQDTPAHLSTEEKLSRLCSWVDRAGAENIAYTFELPGFDPLALASGSEQRKTSLRALAAFSLVEASQPPPEDREIDRVLRG